MEQGHISKSDKNKHTSIISKSLLPCPRFFRVTVLHVTNKQVRPWREVRAAIVNAFEDERLLGQLKIQLQVTVHNSTLPVRFSFGWESRDFQLENYSAPGKNHQRITVELLIGKKKLQNSPSTSVWIEN